MHTYTLEFHGLVRQLPLTYISPTTKIASFSIIGDHELTEKAADEMEKKLRQQHILPDCFVAPETNAVPFVYALAQRFGHKRYVILRKSIRSYMIRPVKKLPPPHAPKHLSKLVLDGIDQEYLKGKKIVLLDDIVSTGATIQLATTLLQNSKCEILANAAIFKQGNTYKGELVYLADLPLVTDEK